MHVEAVSRTEIRCFDFVDHAYARVRDVLVEDPARVFRDATRSASARAASLASELHTSVAGLHVAAEIVVTIGKIEEDASGLYGLPVTVIPISWEAAHHPQWYPLMTSARLKMYPLTPTETELDFTGHYQPPGGAVGSAVNALIGHRIANATVHRFLADVASFLRSRLSES